MGLKKFWLEKILHLNGSILSQSCTFTGLSFGMSVSLKTFRFKKLAD